MLIVIMTKTMESIIRLIRMFMQYVRRLISSPVVRRAANDHLCSQPADQQNTAVNRKLHQRCIRSEHVFLRLTENFVNVYRWLL